MSLNLNSFLDAVVPGRGAKRELAELRLQVARGLVAELGYDAARRQRSDGWTPVTAGPNTLALWDGPRAIAAAHDAARNNPLASRAVDMLPAYIVGPGYRPMLPQLESADARRPYLDLWRRFVDECCREGLWDFHHYARLVTASMIEGGYAFIEYLDQTNARAPLRIQGLEAEFLDQTRISPIAPGASDGALIVNGIEFDPAGRRVAHWLHPAHPGDTRLLRTTGQSRRIPIDQVDMVFRPRRLGELVPITWLASAVQTLRDRKDYLDAERARARTQALLAIFVQGSEAGALNQVATAQRSDAIESAAQPRGLTDANGEPIDRIASGAVVYGGHGQQITMLEPKGQAAQQMVLTTADHDVAAGLSVPYFLLTGNYAGANFSTARMALNAFRQQLTVWQPLIARLIYRRAWLRVMEAGQRLGQIPRGEIPIPEWAFPPLYSADPLKDVQEKSARLERGIDSEIAIIESEGRDPEAVLEEQMRWRELRVARGLADPEPAGADPARDATAGSDDDEREASGEDADDGSDGGPPLDLNEFGQAVRAGLLTPEQPLEEAVRARLGLPAMGPPVAALWAGQPVRRPITLTEAAAGDEAAPQAPQSETEE
ncbi:MAG: phage portal protein [Pseudomonadota bacterium]